MTRRWDVAQCVLVLAALSCGDATAPIGDERAKLDANRQAWSRQGLHSYTFTLRQDCFCAVNGPVRVTVDHDTVVAAIQVSTSQPVDRRFVQTITSLFDFIGRGIDAHAAVLTVTYDPTLGYPSVIVYDGSATIADDEVTFTVSNVVSGVVSLMEPPPPLQPGADRRPPSPVPSRF